MGFIGSLFSGSKGAGFQGERAASTEQANELYLRQWENLNQQKSFMDALYRQSPQAIADMETAAKSLRAAVAGRGDSVAQRQLAESTGEGVAAQQALMAGQRGGSANVGLMAREAALAGGRLRQQAAGQAATLRAQEQAQAQAALANLGTARIGQAQTAQGQGMEAVSRERANVLQSIANLNQTQAGIAAGNQAFQSGLVGGVLGTVSGALKGGAAGGMAAGGMVDDEDEDSFSKSFAQGMQSASSPMSSQLNPYYEQIRRSGMSAGLGMKGAAKSLLSKAPMVSGAPGGGYAGANLGLDTSMPTMINPMATSGAIGSMPLPLNKGGKVDAMVSPGEKYLSPKQVEQVKRGQKEPLNAGKTIPGKAKVKGDSYANDTVPAKLEEGGIVIPRSVVQSKNPEEQARKFVAAVLAKQKQKRK